MKIKVYRHAEVAELLRTRKAPLTVESLGWRIFNF
jgi:hypothetical protein